MIDTNVQQIELEYIRCKTMITFGFVPITYRTEQILDKT